MTVTYVDLYKYICYLPRALIIRVVQSARSIAHFSYFNYTEHQTSKDTFLTDLYIHAFEVGKEIIAITLA